MEELEAKHKDMVKALAKDGQTIINELTADKAHLLHMAVGVAGEGGELLDAIKKHVIYNKSLGSINEKKQTLRENVIEELGDLEFYMEGVRERLGITREETLQQNFSKLGKRYEGMKYSNQAAQDRADKKEEHFEAGNTENL